MYTHIKLKLYNVFGNSLDYTVHTILRETLS